MDAPGEQRAPRLGRNASTLCSKCGEPAERQLGFDRYCDECLEAILGPIREKVNALNAFNGIGVAGGPRPDYGPGWYDLHCDSCDAAWVGKRGEPCDWCTAAHHRLIEAQKHTLLHPELPDPADARRRQAETAWAERLGRAVAAGLLERNVARRALDHELAKSGPR